MRDDSKYCKCNDTRECFARGRGGFCEILRSVYPPGKCPWCKPDENITNGKRYRRVK